MPISHRAAAATLCAISGFAVILTMGVKPSSADGALFVGFATGGAALGGVATAPLFGWPGRNGVVLAALGAVAATALGAALAGFAIGLPSGLAGAGLVYGPVTVGAALATSPVVLAAWVLTMACAHQGMAQMRRVESLPD